MKLVIDEKLKHRLIGVAVIISLGAIFAPAMMKKSNQNMENNYSVRVKLPSKPNEPSVAIADEKEVFKTIKIAKVKIPDVATESQLPELAKAEVLHSEVVAHRELATIEPTDEELNAETVKVALKQAAQNSVKHTVNHVAKNTHTKPTTKAVTVASKGAKSGKNASIATVKPKIQPHPVKVATTRIVPKKPAMRSDIYAVQLASFSRLSNAQALVNKLHSRGYKANFIKVASRQGITYKVYAGHSPRKTDVLKVKTQLASAMQLNGFIVNTGVS